MCTLTDAHRGRNAPQPRVEAGEGGGVVGDVPRIARVGPRVARVARCAAGGPVGGDGQRHTGARYNEAEVVGWRCYRKM